MTDALLLLVLIVLQSLAGGLAAQEILKLPAPAITERSGSYLTLFLALAIGLALDILALLVLGFTGNFNRPSVLLTAAFIGCSSLLILWARPDKARRAFEGLRAMDAVVMIIFLALLVLAASKAPGHFDDTMYHLPLARSYLEHERIVVEPFLRFPLFPQNMHLLIAIGQMFAGELGAQMLATLPLPIVVVGLLGASLWLTRSLAVGVIAGAALFLFAPVRQILGYAYIDYGLMLFCWAACVCVGLWAQTATSKGAWRWLLIAGALAGMAAGSKYFGALVAVLLATYLLAVRRQWRGALVFGLAALVTGIWWYLRSFLISGDPVHPAGGSIFGYYLWDAADLANQKAEQAGYRPSASSILVVAVALISLTMRDLPAMIRPMRFVLVGYVAAWLLLTHVSRYLLPIVPIALLFVFYLIFQLIMFLVPRISARTGMPSAALLERRWIHTGITGLAIAALGLLFVVALRSSQLSAGERDAMLRNRDGHNLFVKANHLIPDHGNRLMQLGFEQNIYFFNGLVIGDWFGPGRYRQMLDCKGKVCALADPAKLHRVMGEFGANMVAVSTSKWPFSSETFREHFEVAYADRDGVLLIARKIGGVKSRPQTGR